MQHNPQRHRTGDAKPVGAPPAGTAITTAPTDDADTRDHWTSRLTAANHLATHVEHARSVTRSRRMIERSLFHSIPGDDLSESVERRSEPASEAHIADKTPSADRMASSRNSCGSLSPFAQKP